MLSRGVGRLTTMSAQVIGATSTLWRDNAHAGPKVAQNPQNSHATTLCPTTICNEPLRQRSTSINYDPILVITAEEENDVIHELELLDLDRWNSDRYIAPRAAPSSSISYGDQKLDSNPWMENFIDLSSLDFEQGLDRSCIAPPSSPDIKPQLEVQLERASNLVDWEAWSRYLDEDEEMQPEQMVDVKTELVEDSFSVSNPYNFTSSTVPSISRVASQSTYFQPTKNIAPAVKIEVDDIKDWDNSLSVDQFAASGPLMWTPASEEEEKVSTRRDIKKPKRYIDSARSVSPASFSSDEYVDSKPSFKKRGVIMKPSVDFETDRRRALNREAALRYREKKRHEQVFRKKELQSLIDRNRSLRVKERHLRNEIAKIRQKLVSVGAL